MPQISLFLHSLYVSDCGKLIDSCVGTKTLGWRGLCAWPVPLLLSLSFPFSFPLLSYQKKGLLINFITPFILSS